ncbi:hypothetical protein [Sediminibacterium sp.]|uniref:hypothetical protein n=1 Tax=Sediminibacterium sp. TaxID=1917865 RepID=UPI002733DC85|nr:hypothetical protein [Sediminibacterium sp.]MDP3394511.1 hypothetical protein [Sediminibacterium sp.]MDP3568346.1 hypothetical protein [Sediminibacterium sp.]
MKPMNVFFAAILSLLLFSCKKSDNPVPGPVVETKLLKKIYTSPNDFQLFTYNESKQLVKLTNQYVDDPINNGIITEEAVLTYESNKLNKVQYADGYMTYHYTGDKLDSIRKYTLTSRLVSVDFPQINAQNQLLSITTRLPGLLPLLPVAAQRVFTYDAAGNLIGSSFALKMTNNSDFVLQERTVFSGYDSKRNPDQFSYTESYIPGMVFMKNNPGRMQVYDHSNDLSEDISFVYQFDTAGNIIKKTSTTVGSPNAEVAFYEYY